MKRDKKRARVTFHVAVLLYREEVMAARDVWFARSVTTSDVAFGDSADEALEHLQAILRTSMEVARSRGMGPHDWLSVQKPDEPRWIEEWLRLWAPPRGRVVKMRPMIEGCEIEAKVAIEEAA